MLLVLCGCVCSDVHGLHPHGATGQEAEPEQSREGTRAGEGHRQHQRSARPRPQEERQEVLLRPKHRSALCLKLNDVLHNRLQVSLLKLLALNVSVLEVT